MNVALSSANSLPVVDLSGYNPYWKVKNDEEPLPPIKGKPKKRSNLDLDGIIEKIEKVLSDPMRLVPYGLYLFARSSSDQIVGHAMRMSEDSLYSFRGGDIEASRKLVSKSDWLFSTGLVYLLSGKRAANFVTSWKISDFGDFRINQLMNDIINRDEKCRSNPSFFSAYLYQIFFQDQNSRIEQSTAPWGDKPTVNGIYGGQHLNILHNPQLNSYLWILGPRADGGPKFQTLNLSELISRLKQVAVFVNANRWTEEIDQLHKELLGVSYPDLIGTKLPGNRDHILNDHIPYTCQALPCPFLTNTNLTNFLSGNILEGINFNFHINEKDENFLVSRSTDFNISKCNTPRLTSLSQWIHSSVLELFEIISCQAAESNNRIVQYCVIEILNRQFPKLGNEIINNQKQFKLYTPYILAFTNCLVTAGGLFSWISNFSPEGDHKMDFSQFDLLLKSNSNELLSKSEQECGDRFCLYQIGTDQLRKNGRDITGHSFLILQYIAKSKTTPNNFKTRYLILQSFLCHYRLTDFMTARSKESEWEDGSYSEDEFHERFLNQLKIIAESEQFNTEQIDAWQTIFHTRMISYAQGGKFDNNGEPGLYVKHVFLQLLIKLR